MKIINVVCAITTDVFLCYSNARWHYKTAQKQIAETPDMAIAHLTATRPYSCGVHRNQPVWSYMELEDHKGQKIFITLSEPELETKLDTLEDCHTLISVLVHELSTRQISPSWQDVLNGISNKTIKFGGHCENSIKQA